MSYTDTRKSFSIYIICIPKCQKKPYGTNRIQKRYKKTGNKPEQNKKARLLNAMLAYLFLWLSRYIIPLFVVL